MANVRPIKPSEVVKQKKVNFPDAVFEVFNALIAKNFSGSSSHVYQKDAVAELKKRGLSASEVYENHWLDVEGVYRAAGWSVKYDKPAYCESYEPYFVFSKKV